MSSNDKTRQKLVESMRKTKIGANKNTSGVDTEEKSKSGKAATKQKPVSAKKVAAKTTDQVHADPYQSRNRRVWPD